MLEFVKGNKKVRLWYQFDSSYVDEGYEKYDFDEFHYDIDIDEVKETIADELMKIIGRNNQSSLVLLEVIDELDGWEVLDWFNLIKKAADILKDYYEIDAMEYFIENRYEATRDDIDDMEVDRSLCE